MSPLAWDPASADVVLLLVSFALAWGVLRYVFTKERLGVLGRRSIGGTWLAVTAVAALVACGRSPLDHGINTFDLTRTLQALGGLVAVCLPVVALAGRGVEVRRMHPEIRGQVPTRTVVASALAWGVFLAGYEFVFRGALLWFGVVTWGVWPALAITSVLYMFVHLPKDAPGETFASLVMGFVFGAAALWSGSFIVAWLLHWAIAVTTENVAGRVSSDVQWGGVSAD